MRLLGALLMAALATGAAAQDADAPVPDPGWSAWVEAFRPRALAAGIPEATLEAAFEGAGLIPRVIERDRTQSEFTRPLAEYLAIAVSEDRVALGRRALEENRALLERIEAEFGVDKEVVVAIWGLESSYGADRGTVPTVSALSTLAFEGRRGAFFEAQLVAALRILAGGHVAPGDFRGSWAGAMGHTQFMPTSWEAHAVDFSGDGRRDVWSDDPADALASTAAYLGAFGWTLGQPWGVEVALPPGFDLSLARDTNRQATAYWAGLGVRDVAGGIVPNHGGAVILLPAGAGGPAFMTFRNFTVIERYNVADAYVIGVGALASRIAGGPGVRAEVPLVRALTGVERVELQERLTAAGFDTLGIDGLTGPRTVGAVRNWQRARGLPPDGLPSEAVLEALRAEETP